MKTSIAKELILSYTLIIALTGAVSAAVGTRLISRRVMEETQEKVRNDLNTAREIYSSYLREVRTILHFTADRHTLRAAMASGNIRSELQKLRKIKEEEGLDILTVTDERGTVVLRVNNPDLFGDDQSSDALLQQAGATQAAVAATKIVPGDELAKESRELAEKAYFKLIDTPKARPKTKAEETAGMMIMAAAPMFDFNNRLVGFVYGGILVNRNYAIVDKIKQTVYQGMKYKGKDMGTATIFQDDVRISTNVLTEDGSRAVGTRAAEDVYRQVVERGMPWVDRAFVVNDWYITAYEPIRTIDGRNIGILYVGVLEQKYADIRKETMAVFLGVTFLSLIVSLVISYFLSRNISRAIRKLAAASHEMAAGKLDVQVDIKSRDELGELAQAFNYMASALKERDERLKEYATKKIMESERLALIGQLAAGVAHEINNPLQGILSYSELLLENTPPDDPDGEFVRKIGTQATRCKNIIRGLLDFSRQSAPEMKYSQVNSALLESLALVEKQSLFQNIEIVKNLDRDLPRTTFDGSQMQQVFMNIIINAAEAMDGRGRLTIATRTDPAKKSIEIEIADTGVGIRKENLDKIFDPFFTTKGVGHGTGLGLAVSYGIVKKHGGTIEVQSEVGVGTTFILRLPIIGDADKDARHERD